MKEVEQELVPVVRYNAVKKDLGKLHASNSAYLRTLWRALLCRERTSLSAVYQILIGTIGMRSFCWISHLEKALHNNRVCKDEGAVVSRSSDNMHHDIDDELRMVPKIKDYSSNKHNEQSQMVAGNGNRVVGDQAGRKGKQET